MKYTQLSDAQQAAIREQHTKRNAPPTVDPALIGAWEADHYAHSLLADQATGDAKKPHQDAMKQIEKALKDSTTA